MTTVEKKSYKNLGNAAVLRHIPNGAQTILDVGCGAGDNARILATAGKVVDGITLSDSERDDAKRFCRNVVIHNLENGLPAQVSGPYDCVLCSHVLEHICWPERLLADIRSRLHKDGLLLVALPNMLFWKNRWRIFTGILEYQESGLMDNTHFRWYSFTSAQRMLSRNGFEILSAQAEGSFPIPLRRRIFPQTLTKPIDGWASALFPGLFGLQMIYTARVREANKSDAFYGDSAKKV
jgi:SAM-dependent methyltransferase